ncbi:Periplasmic oligopeptide-binding protein precursor [Planctomycetes bacterium Poly30]|uniref:Periplasmic oligopeptide-binding protein n=1 Tax=Saltatorellus ferox TaxID=2528018 RepID=A0A518EVZ4_9BACT|nr:Periplasmic oligopeptide-binding protein precursor [Planctomycetes bacterium Poly30]
MAPQRFLRQVLPVLLLLGILAAAVYATRGARLAPADFVFNNGTEIQTLDPATVTGVPEGRAIRMVFEGLLVAHPKTLEPQPGCAESWEVSDDGLTYTFHLRKNARWSNGDLITADDFMWSFERFLDPRTAAEYAYMAWYIEGAEAFTTEVEDGAPKHSFDTVGIKKLDDYTLQFHLNSPTPFFLELMAFYPMFPVSRKNIEDAKEKYPNSWSREWLKPENIICNGPYVVEFRRVNDRVRFKKNPMYWDADNVAFETVDALAVESYTTSLNMYLTGAAQWIDVPPANVIQELMPREDFLPIPYLGSYFYRVNVTKPPLDNKLVRQALSLAIPRQAITESVTKAGQVPAYSLVPPGMAGYTGAEMAHGSSYEADLARARELIVEAGYGPGGKQFPTIEVHYNTADSHRDIAIVIADAWAKNLGVNVKLLNQEWKVYLDTQSSLGYDVSRSAWIGDYADPNTYIDLFMTGGENNKTGWGDPEYDRLVRMGNSELDPAKRMSIMAEAEALLMDAMAIMPIYFYVTQTTYSPRLGGYYPNVKDEHFPKYWYWMDDEELSAKRAAYPDDGRHEEVKAWGPSEGLYPPSHPKARNGQRPEEPQEAR